MEQKRKIKSQALRGKYFWFLLWPRIELNLSESIELFFENSYLTRFHYLIKFYRPWFVVIYSV